MKINKNSLNQMSNVFICCAFLLFHLDNLLKFWEFNYELHERRRYASYYRMSLKNAYFIEK